MFFLRYLWKVFISWTVLVFTIVDVASYCIATFALKVEIPTTVYLIIAVLGYVASNVVVYFQQESKIKKYESEEAEITIKILNTHFYYSSHALVDKVPYPDGLNKNNIPVDSRLVADMELENTGKEIGAPIFTVDLKKTKLPELFAFGKEHINGFSPSSMKGIEGRGRAFDRYNLWLEVVETDPAVLIQKLNELKTFDVFVNYYTKRIGEPSKSRTMKITACLDDYIKKLVEAYKSKDLNI